jgi:hypothetical protein
VVSLVLLPFLWKQRGTNSVARADVLLFGRNVGNTLTNCYAEAAVVGIASKFA